MAYIAAKTMKQEIGLLLRKGTNQWQVPSQWVQRLKLLELTLLEVMLLRMNMVIKCTKLAGKFDLI